jgi:VCBS repeat-containing protein
VVVIEADNATDNKYINKAEFEAVGKPAKLKVYASFDNVNKTVTTDDFVVFTVNGVAQTPRKLTTAEVTAGKAYIDVDTPAEDGKVTVTAFLQDAALNKTEIGSDETTLDTIAPNTDPKNPNTLVAPVIHIDNDKSEPGNADGDTYVNATELAAFNGFFQVTATFNAANVKLGDSVTFNAKEILGAATSTRAAITRLLTVDEIRIGSATEKFAAPAEGSTLQVTALLEDAAQNKSLLSNTDSATLKKDLPTATSGLAPVSDTGVGTGKNTDGITDDATPLIHVTSGSTVTKIVLKNITPGVVDNNPLSIPVSIDSNGNVQVPTDLAVGKYKPYITIIDSVKNENTVEGAEFIVTKIQAGPDTNWVQEGGLNIAETSITSQSTNANVTLNDKDAYSQLPSVASSKLMTISAFSYHDTIAGVDKSLNVGQDYLTKYGTFNVSSNGKYTYSLNDAAQSLITGQSVFEEFKYNVTSADGFTAFDVSFKIEVKGANDASTFDMVYTSSGTPDLNSPSNSVFVGNGSVDSYVKSKYSIQIIDADFQQSYLQDFSQHLKGVSGDFSLTLENAGDSSMHRYSWGYTQTTDNLSNTTNHDLLTVMSRDGLSIITLDGKSGSVETNPIHNFYTSTVYGLTARGHSEATYDDTLFLNGNGLFLDLTAATTHVTEIDSINLTGSGANTVKLDLRTLLSMSTTQHQLYIVGNAGDTVQLVGGSAWGNADLASHNGYTTYKNGLDELIIQNTINNITFV